MSQNCRSGEPSTEATGTLLGHLIQLCEHIGTKLGAELGMR